MSNTSSLPVSRTRDIDDEFLRDNVDIKAVEKEIKEAAEKIEAARKKIEAAEKIGDEAALLRAEEECKLWWKEKEQLRDKEAELRKGKADQGEVPVPSPKRPKTSWKKLGDVQSVDYNAESVIRGERETITVPGCFLDAKGLRPRTTDEQVVLYCRENCRKQFEFLHTDVVRDSKIGWILGPPGGGKSITTLAFAATLLPSDWLITWVHVEPDYDPIYLRFDHVAKTLVDRAIDVSASNYVEASIFEPVLSERKHIVIVDGMVTGNAAMQDLKVWFNEWVRHDRERRRLVFVSSMSTRGKKSEEFERQVGVKEFFVHSWSLEEYLSGAEQPSFFNSVTSFLDADLPGAPSSGELISNAADQVKAKYHFAGGSCRYMFDMNTEAVIDSISESLDAAGVMPYIQGTAGDIARAVRIDLFVSYPDSCHGRIVSIVSTYAASELAIIIGPDKIIKLAEWLGSDSNPALEGWLLESYFFAHLRHNGVDLVANDAPITWEWSSVKSLDPGDVSAWSEWRADTAFWMKPKRWNNGGYDACYIVPKDGIVRFVQFTRAKDHSCRLGFFSSLLTQLNTHFPVKTVEVFFVVPKDRLHLFDISYSMISGRGLLEKFDKSWVKGDEMKRVQIVGITFQSVAGP